MDSRRIPFQIITFSVYIAVQVLFIRNLVLFDTAFCFVYVAFLLLIPFETGPLIFMVLAFLTGIVIDIFYDSLGIHSAACVLLAFIRPYWIKLLTPRGGYEQSSQLSLKVMGLEWFSTYGFSLIFLHHLTLFFLEAGSFQWFFFTLSKAFFSAIFSFSMVVIFQYMAHVRRRF